MKNLLLITTILSLFSLSLFAGDTPEGADQCANDRVVVDKTKAATEADGSVEVEATKK